MSQDDTFQRRSVRVIRDVEVDPERPYLKVDVYVPPDDLERPPEGWSTISYVHGGAWTFGDKAYGQPPCESLAREGYLCVAASYRLSSFSNEQLETIFIVLLIIMMCLVFTSDNMTSMMVNLAATTFILSTYVMMWKFNTSEGVQHPDHIMDVSRCVAWTMANAEKYGGRGEELYLLGHSAGAHLASLAATEHSYLKRAGGDPSKIRGCICVSGVYNDHRLKETPLGQQLLHSVFGKQSEYYSSFAVHHVNDKTPRFMLINAIDHDIGLLRQSMDFLMTLREHAIWGEIHYVKDSHHVNIIKDWGKGESNNETLTMIMDFISRGQQADRMKLGTQLVDDETVHPDVKV